MFTGIVQGVATVATLTDRAGLRTLALAFPPNFLRGVETGASIALDGVCLTVTRFDEAACMAEFDVMQQTLNLTTLGKLGMGSQVNAERAAREGAEVGGHALSGHVDFCATVEQIRRPDNNFVLRFAVPAPWMRYVFAKGYIAVNGASLTVAEAFYGPDKGTAGQEAGSGWFEVWLIPETLRMTTFADKREGDAVHIEIERSTQVMVDTVRRTVDERLGPLLPLLQRWAQDQGIDLKVDRV
jgi:riboflavin synthase